MRFFATGAAKTLAAEGSGGGVGGVQSTCVSVITVGWSGRAPTQSEEQLKADRKRSEFLCLFNEKCSRRESERLDKTRTNKRGDTGGKKAAKGRPDTPHARKLARMTRQGERETSTEKTTKMSQ